MNYINKKREIKLKLREEIQEFTLKKISYILNTVQKTNVDNLIICKLTIKNYCFKLFFR